MAIWASQLKTYGSMTTSELLPPFTPKEKLYPIKIFGGSNKVHGERIKRFHNLFDPDWGDH